MCLITAQKEAIILTEDLIVYKSFSSNLWALYQYFQYEINKLYKTELTFNDGKYNPCFDSMTARHLEIMYHSQWYSISLFNLGLIAVVEGFHSAATEDRLGGEYNIRRCLIPAGSEVFYDETGLIVSNQIIVL